MNKKVKVVELKSLDRFRNDVLSTQKPEKIEELLSWYLGVYGGINFTFGYDRPIFRARKCYDRNGFSNISEIYPPPPEKCQIGRMNEKGKAIFYGSYSLGTALAEINAKEGEYIQVAHFNLPKKADHGIRCFAIGEIYNSYHGNSTISSALSDEIRKLTGRLGKNDIHALLSFLYMDAFSAELLNSINASSINYIYSRIFSRLLLNKHPDIDGLIYPSAKIKGSANIVLRTKTAEEKLNLSLNVVLEIIKVYPYGIVDFNLIRSAKGHTSSGDIIW